MKSILDMIVCHNYANGMCKSNYLIKSLSKNIYQKQPTVNFVIVIKQFSYINNI